jgi:magnesium chelatase family protein
MAGRKKATIRFPRQRQITRFSHRLKVNCNARMGSRELKTYCALDDPTMELLKFAMADLKLSARATGF